MRGFRLPVLILAGTVWAGSLGADPADGELWGAALGKGDGTNLVQSFRVVRRPAAGGLSVETFLPARGPVASKVRVDLGPRGALVRSRTEYPDPELASWYRADLILTEVQPGQGEGGGDNLAFQRVWKNEVQDARNLAWGPDFVEFSALPFVLESRLGSGDLSAFRFRTYYTDLPGTMEVTLVRTDRPLDAEKRYSYPRALRWRFDRRPVILAVLNAVGDFKGGYPYPFYYAFSAGENPRWVASWGGNPQSPTFQWRE